jgi:hypothetical protein
MHRAVGGERLRGWLIEAGEPVAGVGGQAGRACHARPIWRISAG